MVFACFCWFIIYDDSSPSRPRLHGPNESRQRLQHGSRAPRESMVNPWARSDGYITLCSGNLVSNGLSWVATRVNLNVVPPGWALN